MRTLSAPIFSRLSRFAAAFLLPIALGDPAGAAGPEWKTNATTTAVAAPAGQKPADTPAANPSPGPAASRPAQSPSPHAKPAESGFGQYTYASVNIDGQYAALTFDDGPHATNTPRLLGILAEKGVKATFFVVGQCAAEYPEIMRRIVEEGHEVANHSWSHPNFAKLSDAAVRSQLDKTAAAIRETTGKTTDLFRPPYGSLTARQRQWLGRDLGLKLIYWSVDPLDWRRPGASVVARRILAGATPGGIILAHDIHAGTIDAMDETIDGLKARGFRFATVSELLAMEKPKPKPVVSAESSESPSPSAGGPSASPAEPSGDNALR